MLNIEDAAEAERIFNSLSQSGAVQMPLQETFCAMRSRMLVDQFGTPWTAPFAENEVKLGQLTTSFRRVRRMNLAAAG